MVGNPQDCLAAERAPAARVNARLRGAQLRALCALDQAGRDVLIRSVERLGLSARVHDKVLRVARTIADLDESPSVRKPHIAEAISFRLSSAIGGL